MKLPETMTPDLYRAAVGMPPAVVPSWERLRLSSELCQGVEIPAEAIKTFSQAMGQWVINDAHGFWLEPDDRDGHCDPQAFVTTMGQRVSALHNAYNGSPTQSPIEDMLMGALIWLSMDWAGFPEFDYMDGPADSMHSIPSDGLLYWLTPQAKLAGHKVDFLLWFQMGTAVGGIAIECDGHDFHEKTKEQAARDKKRDREILKAGYPVMRFSGSEVFRDCLGCVEQVRDVLSETLLRVSRDGGLFGGGNA